MQPAEARTPNIRSSFFCALGTLAVPICVNLCSSVAFILSGEAVDRMFEPAHAGCHGENESGHRTDAATNATGCRPFAIANPLPVRYHFSRQWGLPSLLWENRLTVSALMTPT
jgi:hypothetical protein